MTVWARGTLLTKEQQDEAKRRFVHRYTGEHVPSWVVRASSGPHFETDADWLAHTLFAMTDDMKRFDNRYHRCQTLRIGDGKQ